MTCAEKGIPPDLILTIFAVFKGNCTGGQRRLVDQLEAVLWHHVDRIHQRRVDETRGVTVDEILDEINRRCEAERSLPCRRVLCEVYDWIEERSKPVAEEQQQEELKRCRGSVGDANGRIRCAYCGHTDPCYCQCPGGKYSHDPFSDEGGLPFATTGKKRPIRFPTTGNGTV